MDHIIVNFRPFALEQDILVYVKGKCVQQTKVSIDKIPDIVMGLKNTYDIKQIDLCGNQDYLSKFKAELGLRFSNDNIKIDIISR